MLARVCTCCCIRSRWTGGLCGFWFCPISCIRTRRHRCEHRSCHLVGRCATTWSLASRTGPLEPNQIAKSEHVIVMQFLCTRAFKSRTIALYLNQHTVEIMSVPEGRPAECRLEDGASASRRVERRARRGTHRTHSVATWVRRSPRGPEPCLGTAQQTYRVSRRGALILKFNLFRK